MPPRNQNSLPPAPPPQINPPVFIWILLIIASLIGSVEIYRDSLHQINTQKQQSNTSIKTDELTGWKTYRNEEYGFEVKYPATFLPSWPDGVFVSSDTCNITFQKHFGGKWPKGCQIYALYTNANQTVNLPVDEVRSIEVSGFPAEQVYFSTGRGYENNAQWMVQFQKNDIWYVQSFNFPKNNLESSEKLFNQILSTFKFVK